ncbi:MAG: FAD-dependent monooxygenase [Chloroflexi bacterium]|nr:FAD-dependent monooxygenase [Chloroflexota bacterium]
MNTSTLPVLIVGAGPVGLSLALALSKNGIPVELFEADKALNDEIRASTLHPPTLEMLAEWGVIEGVLTRGFKVEQLMYWERATREQIAAFDYAAIANDTPYPYRLQCPQHILTRVLKPAVEQMETAVIHMNHRFTHYTDHGTHITATFETATGTKTVNGRYLCGADGANSTVRKQTGMTFKGITYADRFLLIGTDYDFTTLFPNFGPVNYIYDPQEWVIILRLPDLRRVVFRLRDDEQAEEAMAEAALHARMWRFIGQNEPFNVKTTQLYRVHQRVAETFRLGRVLLLGDAAHINNPAGGMGMNSGIHDAHALAEALTTVCTGNPDTLLDAYSQSRRTVALESIHQTTDKNYKDLAATDPNYRQRRNTNLQIAAANPTHARAYLLKASMLTDRI